MKGVGWTTLHMAPAASASAALALRGTFALFQAVMAAPYRADFSGAVACDVVRSSVDRANLTLALTLPSPLLCTLFLP